MKRLLSIILICAAAASCMLSVSAAQSEWANGDVNHDCRINNKDVTILFRYLCGEDVAVDEASADVNGDGFANNKDITNIFRRLSENGFPEYYYPGTPAYTENGDTLTVNGVTYPNTADMKNGALYAVDDLGREVSTDYPSYTYDGSKNVGLFYFLFLGEHGDDGIWNTTEILAAGGDDAKKASYEGWGPVESMHFWDQPLYGYYYSSDLWVMTKHVEMFVASGVDFLFIDVTNAFPYISNASKLMYVLDNFRTQGYHTPKIVFYTHTRSADTVQSLYDSIYSRNQYPDLWLYVDGKPLIIAYESECSQRGFYDFFSYREPQWPYEAQITNAWPWMEARHPQRMYYNKAGEAESISVSVAQHSGTWVFSDSAIYGNKTNYGRSRTSKKTYTHENAAYYGYNFAEQWETAISKNAKYVLVTGWNEWVAQRQQTTNDTVKLIDNVNMEYSRDIEPMKGGYFDAYYMQMTDYIRRYKGCAPVMVQNTRKTIDINESFDQWDDILVEYSDAANDTTNRNSYGFGRTLYKNRTVNNDITGIKITHDEENMYFYIKCASNIKTPAAGNAWLQLFINTDMNADTGFYGYDYLVNYGTPGTNTTKVGKLATGKTYSVESTSQVNYRKDGKEVMIKVPLEALGITDFTHINFAFKCVDSKTEVTTMEQMYSDGDCAPIGRFSFIYKNFR